MPHSNYLKSIFFLSISVLLFFSPSLAAPQGNSAGVANNPHRGIEARLAAMEQMLIDIKRDTVTCTAQAKSRGECDNVRSSKVSACFDLTLLDASLPIKWRTEIEAKAEGGVAWTSGPDGKIIINMKMPAGPVPTDFGLDVKVGGSLKANVCIDFPIQLIGGGTFSTPFATRSLQASSLTEDQFDTLQMKLEEASTAIVPLILDRINADLPDGQRIRTGFDAMAAIANGEFDLRNGIFTDRSGNGPLREIIRSLPVPALLRTAIENPGEFTQYLPSPQRGLTLKERVARLCDPDSGMVITRSPLFASQIDDTCQFLTGVPQFDKLAEFNVDDIVEGIRQLIQPLLSELGETATETKTRFCDTEVGKRRIFDRFCGR